MLSDADKLFLSALSRVSGGAALPGTVTTEQITRLVRDGFCVLDKEPETGAQFLTVTGKARYALLDAKLF